MPDELTVDPHCQPHRRCKKCGELKPATPEYFNILRSGNYRGTCKKCMAANSRAHQRRNPEKVQARVDKYKRELAAAAGDYDDFDIARIRAALEDRCAYCGVDLGGGGEKDHIVPISRGGTNWPSNITLACRTCNRDKHNKTADEFLEWQRTRG